MRTPRAVTSSDARDAAEGLAHANAYSGAAVPRTGVEGAAPANAGEETRERPDTAIAAKMGAGG
jgi:hypothetical protein